MIHVMGSFRATMNCATKRQMNQRESNLLTLERLNFTWLDRKINFD